MLPLVIAVTALLLPHVSFIPDPFTIVLCPISYFGALSFFVPSVDAFVSMV